MYTIVSQITPFGYSAVGIIRISGNLVNNIINIIIKKKIKPRYVYYLDIFSINGNILDKGIVFYFKKPNSYTGEDILELHAHGGPLIINLIIKEILKISKNIHIAKPGEFTQRAFINKKIDLFQAESINTLIHNNYELSIPYIINNIKGKGSIFIKSILKKIINIEILIENNLNFDINHDLFLNNIKLIIKGLIKNIKNICINKNIFNNLLNNGIKLIIIGPPNSGKSSLFNSLLKWNRAIVTNIKGTTRDIITENFKLNNYNIFLTDTAGIHTTNDIIENIGIKKTFKNLKKSNYIFYVLDINLIKKISLKNIININNIINKHNKKIFFIFNKIDLIKKKFNIKKISNKKYNFIKIIFLSTNNKKDIYLLKKLIFKEISKDFIKKNNIKILFQDRHIFCLKKCLKHLKNIINKIIIYNNIDDLIAHELLLSKKYLEEILGKNITSNDILENIFKNFCIGK